MFYFQYFPAVKNLREVPFIPKGRKRVHKAKRMSYSSIILLCCCWMDRVKCRCENSNQYAQMATERNGRQPDSFFTL